MSWSFSLFVFLCVFYIFPVGQPCRITLHRSSEQRGTAGLDGLDLGEGDGGPPEPGGEVVAVKGLALASLDGAEVVAAGAADAALAGVLDGLS